MKKAILICVLILCMLLCSCGAEMQTEGDSSNNEGDKYSMFVLLEDCEGTYGFIVVYHKDTKVMYTISRGMYNSGNFTVLRNPDGTPMLYGGK